MTTTYKFKRSSYLSCGRRHYYGAFRRYNGSMCFDEVRKWIKIPENAAAVYVTISNHPSKESYKYKIKPRHDIVDDLMFLNKRGNWKNPYVAALEYIAHRDNWPKTGYIRAEYVE